MQRPWLSPLVAFFVVGFVLVTTGCATIPDGRYGVDRLTLKGVTQLDAYALRACLATKDREYLSIDLSRDPAPTCGAPPFDARRIHLPLWRWSWTEWPLYDPSVFERDLARVERWYRARGFYGANVLDARSTPPDALFGTPPATTPGKQEQDPTKNQVDLEVDVHEGQPVLLHSVTMEGQEGLEPVIGKEFEAALKELTVGQRFDEASYDTTRALLVRALRDAGHASGNVHGKVDIDPTARTADVHFTVTAGPVMELGNVCVTGFGKLPAKLILQASDLRPGKPFSATEIEDARTRIYQMRVLSEVEITAGKAASAAATDKPIDPSAPADENAPPPDENAQPTADQTATRQGEWLAWQDNHEAKDPAKAATSLKRVCRIAPAGDSERPRVPIEIRVKPAQLYRLGVGAGLQIGVQDGQFSLNAAQQWDAHLFGYVEVRNFLGGLRRLRIEERPKLIFLAPFPRAKDDNGERDVRLGNNLSALLEWPAFLEARTLLRLTASWDRGPDPYGAKFIRDDFNIGLGPSRSFFKNRLNIAMAIHFNPYIPRSTYGNATERANTAPLKTERYNLLFLQQVFEWDARNDRNSPTRGFYARVELHETIPPSAWEYIRFTPELRKYFQLPYGLVIAARGGIGWIAITHSTAKTEELRRLGPRPYRLRGGGPYSVRGVQAGMLGRRDIDTITYPGGTKSWIASLELRVPLGDSLGVATFIDAGDVDGGTDSRRAAFRFDRPNTTIGAGLRYKTIVGPVRLDVGWLVPGLQGNQYGSTNVDRRDPLFKFNGAVLLTIGESF